jgi:hypothetical protein
MKMRMMLIPAAIMAAAACGGPNVLGEYGGEKCIYENLSLRPDGVAMVTMMGMEIPGQYRLESGKVILIAPDGTQSPFTIKGSDLVLELMGETMMVCSRK